MKIDRALINDSLSIICPGEVVMIPEESADDYFLVVEDGELSEAMVEVVNIETGTIHFFKEDTTARRVYGKFMINGV